VYAEFFGEHRPARAVVPVGELHHGYAIEVEVTAAVDRP
jgi:enamine deaminase RidA (YjgF/YER057c/UK114 family)